MRRWLMMAGIVWALLAFPGCGACGKKAVPIVPAPAGAAAASAAVEPPRTDCERMAEMICGIEGTSEADCKSSRENARKATSEVEQAACRSIMEKNQPAK